MPRGKGGPREGTPGQAYPNRTDLNAPPQMAANAPSAPVAPTQLPRTPTGQPYGVAKAQADAQHALPLPNASAGPVALPSAAAVPTPAPTGAPTGGLPPPPSPGALTMLPGQLGDFGGATQRPDESVHAGSPLGPGAGPDALNPGLGFSP